MGKVEEIHEKSNVFRELFGMVNVVVETDCEYSYREKRYNKLLLTVKNHVDIFEDEISSYITAVDGAIHEKIERFVRPDIPAQVINNSSQIELFTIGLEDLLFQDDWHLEFYDLLLDTVEEEFTSVMAVNVDGIKENYRFGIRDVYFYEGNSYRTIMRTMF